MNMMYMDGPFAALHMLCCLILGIGILFLVIWAIKTMNDKQLKKWGIGLTVVGIVLCLLACAAMSLHGPGMMRMKVMRDGPMGGTMKIMNGEMNMMDCEMGDMMDCEMDMMSMSMDDMGKMLEGKTGDAFDQAFVEGMIPHHQGAIDMARAALQSAKHDEIKQMARDIISTQQKEIDMMKQWQKDWGYTE